MRWTTLEIDSGLKWWLISLSDGIYPPTIMTTISYYWPNNLIFKRTSQRERSIHNLSYQVPGSARADPPQCLSLAWSADGQTLFAGYSDNLIRVWQVLFAQSFKFFFMPNPYALTRKRKKVHQFISGGCRWHQVNTCLPQSLQLCRSLRKSTALSSWAGLGRGLPAAQGAASSMCTLSTMYSLYVHMQLSLNSVAAIWINWRAKMYLYLLAVYHPSIQTAIKWAWPLCFHSC